MHARPPPAKELQYYAYIGDKTTENRDESSDASRFWGETARLCTCVICGDTYGIQHFVHTPKIFFYGKKCRNHIQTPEREMTDRRVLCALQPPCGFNVYTRAHHGCVIYASVYTCSSLIHTAATGGRTHHTHTYAPGQHM